MTDVTSRFPAVVRSDAAYALAEYVKTRTDQAGRRPRRCSPPGSPTSTGSDSADEAWRQIEAAYARGELSAPRVDPLWPAGRKYVQRPPQLSSPTTGY